MLKNHQHLQHTHNQHLLTDQNQEVYTVYNVNKTALDL